MGRSYFDAGKRHKHWTALLEYIEVPYVLNMQTFLLWAWNSRAMVEG